MNTLLDIMGVKKLPTKIYKTLANKNMIQDLDSQLANRLYHIAILEFQKYSDNIWDLPTKMDRMGYYFTELRFNPDYKIHFDPIMVTCPYIFNSETMTVETLPTNLFRDITKIYLNPDKESFTISYPLPIVSDRVKYLIVEFYPHQFSTVFKEILKVEDHLDKFSQDSYSFKSVEDLSNFINNENQ